MQLSILLIVGFIAGVLGAPFNSSYHRYFLRASFFFWLTLVAIREDVVETADSDVVWPEAISDYA